MSENTNIEWCDATINPWWGCTKVSAGCLNCYAETLSDQRYKNNAWGPKGKRKEIKSWRTTLKKLSKQAQEEGRRLKVFCSSMSDIFEGPETCGGEKSENWAKIVRLRSELLENVVNCQSLDFLLLTKRPENIHRYLDIQFGKVVSGTAGYDDQRVELCLPPNLWIGTSVEDQETADKRIPHLLKVPAKVRFLSCEPLLGPVRLYPHLPIAKNDFEESAPWFLDRSNNEGISPIHWVICGGESGRKPRPMDVEWARGLAAQCKAANVPFFMKQGSQANWPDFKDFNQFPEDLQVREFPTVSE